MSIAAGRGEAREGGRRGGAAAGSSVGGARAAAKAVARLDPTRASDLENMVAEAQARPGKEANTVDGATQCVPCHDGVKPIGSTECKPCTAPKQPNEARTLCETPPPPQPKKGPTQLTEEEMVDTYVDDVKMGDARDIREQILRRGKEAWRDRADPGHLGRFPIDGNLS